MATKKVSAADPAKDNAEKRGRPFEPGNKLGGRTKGARNKLGEAFLEALHDDFQEHGVTAIQTMRAEDPSGYVRVIAGILPKEVKIETTADLTDEQLDNRIRQLASVLEIGIGGPVGGEEAPEGSQQAGGVQTVQ